MGITDETFNEYKRRAFLKLNAHSKVEAIHKAQEIIQL
jgi:DNA-binding CsgD family transcriptional regulator